MKQFIKKEEINREESENPRVKAAIYLTCVASVCTVLVLILVSKHLYRLTVCGF